jgi:hypothetical protein
VNRGIFLGFTYAFGGGKPREPAFDFDAPPSS